MESHVSCCLISHHSRVLVETRGFYVRHFIDLKSSFRDCPASETDRIIDTYLLSVCLSVVTVIH